MDGTVCIIHPFAQSSAQLLHVLQKMGHKECPRIQYSRLDDLQDTLNRNMQDYGMKIVKGATNKFTG